LHVAFIKIEKVESKLGNRWWISERSHERKVRAP